MKRVAVFLDGSNVFYMQKRLGWIIDVEKLLSHCKTYGDVVEATYYTGFTGESAQIRYLDRLAHMGYALVTKPIKTIHDVENGQAIQKSNLDVEIVIDMFDMIDRYDVAVLISGDGDFERAVRQLKSRGKEVKVISSRCSAATELVYAAGINYVDVVSIREDVERKPDELEN